MGDTAMREGLTVYYDASCPLCASEMQAIKERDADAVLTMVDCSPADFAGPSFATRDAMLGLLHVRTGDDRWLVGIDAYQAILRATGYPRLAALLGHPRLRPFADRSYAWIARHRHRLPRRGLARLLRFASRRARAS